MKRFLLFVLSAAILGGCAGTEPRSTYIDHKGNIRYLQKSDADLRQPPVRQVAAPEGASAETGKALLSN